MSLVRLAVVRTGKGPLFCMKSSKNSSCPHPLLFLCPSQALGLVVGGPQTVAHIPGPTVATDVPREYWAALQGLVSGKAKRKVACLSKGLQRGVEGLGPKSDAPDFSCLPRGLQEFWMKKLHNQGICVQSLH